jgi:hypothetical protein
MAVVLNTLRKLYVAFAPVANDQQITLPAACE